MMEAFIIIKFFMVVFLIPFMTLVWALNELMIPPYPPNVVPTGCPDDDEEEEDDEEEDD